jgi:hypothetical protein
MDLFYDSSLYLRSLALGFTHLRAVLAFSVLIIVHSVVFIDVQAQATLMKPLKRARLSIVRA